MIRIGWWARKSTSCISPRARRCPYASVVSDGVTMMNSSCCWCLVWRRTPCCGRRRCPPWAAWSGRCPRRLRAGRGPFAVDGSPISSCSARLQQQRLVQAAGHVSGRRASVGSCGGGGASGPSPCASSGSVTTAGAGAAAGECLTAGKHLWKIIIIIIINPDYFRASPLCAGLPPRRQRLPAHTQARADNPRRHTSSSSAAR